MTFAINWQRQPRPKGIRMKIAALAAAVGVSALALAPHAAADFDNGGRFKTQTPPMLCEIGTDVIASGATAAVCQGLFPEAPQEPCESPICPNPPMHQDQAYITADGQFSYRDANIGVGDHPALNTLSPNGFATISGWTVNGTNDGVKIVAPTGHGMLITAFPYPGQGLNGGVVRSF